MGRADRERLYVLDLRFLPLGATMPNTRQDLQTGTTAKTDDAVLYASLELGYKNWLVTSLPPGSEKMSKRDVAGGDAKALLDLLERLRVRAETNVGKPTRLIVIQEVGLDGFWIHRVLEKTGIENWLVDPASVAVPRRHRRVKTDKIDGEALIRVLTAFKRGEPRVCAMVIPPSPAEEDRRRIGRERSALLKARIQETNRIKGLLLSQGCETISRWKKIAGWSLRSCALATEELFRHI
jgi:transposase